MVSGKIDKGYVLQVLKDNRIVLVLPYKGQVLIGTTECKIETTDSGALREAEITYFSTSTINTLEISLPIVTFLVPFWGSSDVVIANQVFQGESRIMPGKNEKPINVFEGKWTTSRSLAKSVLTLAHQ